jgi:flagellar protein FliS
MDSTYGNSTYANSSVTSYIEQKTLSAEPLELVAMLYLKAISEIREARQHLAEGNIRLRSKAISKACDLIGELDGSLNLEAGGELAQRLRGLYGYCLVRLLDANLHQTDEPLAEVLGLVSTLSEGWQAIAKSEPVTERATAAHWGAPAEAASEEIIGRSHSWTL